MTEVGGIKNIFKDWMIIGVRKVKMDKYIIDLVVCITEKEILIGEGLYCTTDEE